MTDVRRERAAGLLPEVKNYLDVTWEDAAMDEKLTGILARAMQYLDMVAGGAQDYEEESFARALLFDCARYVRSGALDEFRRNYGAELLMLRNRHEVNEIAESMP